MANPFAAAAAAAPANPFAPKPAGGAPAPAPAAANPFAPKPANPFAPAAGAPAAAAVNPFAPKPGAAANPFAPGAANPFAPKTGVAAGGAAGAPTMTLDPQDITIISALRTLADRMVGYGEETDVVQRLRRLLEPYLKLTVDKYAFRAIAYNARDPAAAPPLLMLPEEWERELAERGWDEACTPRMEVMPVVLDGFGGLRLRVDEQEKAIKVYTEHCGKLLSAVQTVEVACDQLRERLERVRTTQSALAHRLLAVASKVDAVVLRGKPEHAEEARLREATTGLRTYLLHHGRVRERIDQLVLALHARGEAVAAGVAGVGAGSRGRLVLDERDMSALVRQLSLHCRGIEQVMGILRRDVRDLEVVKRKVAEARERLRARDSEARRTGAWSGIGFG